MKFKITEYAPPVEILANDHRVGIPMEIDVSSGPVKAGTPIYTGGKTQAAEGLSPLGILLYDVNEDNPNGTVVVHGFIETKKAEKHSGVTVEQSVRDALHMVMFM